MSMFDGVYSAKKQVTKPFYDDYIMRVARIQCSNKFAGEFTRLLCDAAIW